MSWRKPAPRAVAVVLLSLCLGTGVVAGVAIDRFAFGSEVSEYRALEVLFRGPQQPSAAAGRPSHRYLDRLTEELELSGEQRARLSEILARRKSRVAEMLRDFRPRYAALVADTRAEIEAALSAEQRTRYRELREERRRALGKAPGEATASRSSDGR
ncbi:MAG: hypothetical protein HYV63_04980 [Candidatus Schekmanbacteria bacterium]|nr:hypothetical protein [Candidatus Schekmanbacteria bacterium]